ncbi:hypothetical protein QBC36DRAFT_291466 [Triangularia setosa]|uniref:Betaine lipid synthase n=1 Tax=Triangularia setosa TaxID=2587417 RepID=A0AAN6W4W7_9PEZI|nr:hypothetical protein QBC36DRAFT_291466 [Podospora setosa]
MAFLGGNNLPIGFDIHPIFAGITGGLLFFAGLIQLSNKRVPQKSGPEHQHDEPGLIRALFLFCYSCFFKPHSGSNKASQQGALESFYASQASVVQFSKLDYPGSNMSSYDVTRKLLLRGREDMLALAAAQLLHKAEKEGRRANNKRIWVDVGGGTGWNIEAMAQHVNVPEFFNAVYLVDLSPSLCAVAEKRFSRLGWNNVKIICQDARKFRLEDYEDGLSGPGTPGLSAPSYFDQKRPEHGGADLITMSYSLSMIPDYYSVIDTLTSLLSPDGLLGVVDFYTQSKVDYTYRNWTGGLIGRHGNYFSRTFWRAWFDLDRVSLEPARRDYLEYRFGTVLTANLRNTSLGYIPYYIWLGCHKKPFSSSSLPNEIIERIDALATESPYLLPSDISTKKQQNAITAKLTRVIEHTAPEFRSKAFDAAMQNLSANLPLPSFFYQNHHWRIYYDDQLQKHTQFNDEYIYAFTWEDSRVDREILKLGRDDVVLAITSAGDNILSYAMQSPARIHAIDLNPSQNHLLELKVAGFTALAYSDFWKIFGEGKHEDFRELLVTKLSPHLSSRAFQYWLSNASIFTNPKGRGLYDTGGSRYAIRAFRWISYLFNCRKAVNEILASKTLIEQREVWKNKIRPALLSPLVSNLLVSTEAFLWKALGVPKNQLAMIEADHQRSETVKGNLAKDTRAHAIWHYMVNTLDPVVEKTHIAADNPYYLVCMTGQFSKKCHPDYLSRSAHNKLSQPGQFDGLRIHTDEIDEVIARIMPGTLTVAIVMDSMDWFDPESSAAGRQIAKLNRALKMGGRVLLRSSALEPWYVKEFEKKGFVGRRVGNRRAGECIDRVNMYASCWVCTKEENLPPPTPESTEERERENRVGMGGGEVDVWTL